MKSLGEQHQSIEEAEQRIREARSKPGLDAAVRASQTSALGGVLGEAHKLINGERAVSYGDAETSFSRIAVLWGAVLDHLVDTRQVAMMLLLLKVSREISHHDRDNIVDTCGYAALLAELHGEG